MLKKNGLFKIALVDVEKSKEVAELLNCEGGQGLFLLYRGKPVQEHMGKPAKNTINEFIQMAKFFDRVNSEEVLINVSLYSLYRT
jgi:thioredoxin-like negative regulator of GroEL